MTRSPWSNVSSSMHAFCPEGSAGPINQLECLEAGRYIGENAITATEQIVPCRRRFTPKPDATTTQGLRTLADNHCMQGGPRLHRAEGTSTWSTPSSNGSENGSSRTERPRNGSEWRRKATWQTSRWRPRTSKAKTPACGRCCPPVTLFPKLNRIFFRMLWPCKHCFV